jgi:hypothetical protein
MNEKVNGKGRIHSTTPHYGTERNEVGDGRVQTVDRKGLNTSGKR